MEQVTIPHLDWRVIFNRASPAGLRGWGRVRAAQIGEIRRVLHLAAAGQTANALLLVYTLRDHLDSMWLAAWLASLALLMAVATLHHRRWRRDAPTLVSRETIERTGYYSIAFGLVWMVPAFFFFPIVGSNQQLAICIVTAGMMAGAAFVLSSVPPAAGAYVIIMGAAASTMLQSTGSSVTAAIGPAYTAGLMFMVFANGRAFMERRCAELALEERSETISLLLREVESNDADWLWETDPALFFNKATGRFARAAGADQDILTSTSLRDLAAGAPVPDATAARDIRDLLDRIDRRAPFTDALLPVEAPGETRWIKLSARPRFTAKGRFLGYRGVGSDVTERERATRRIAHMARHDSLTGLPNRLHLMEALGDALGTAQRRGGRCALLLIDLDRFKTVNDTLGHAAGDQLLRQVGARIPQLPGGDAIAGRLGGDEFAIILPICPPPDALEHLCRAIVEALQQPFSYRDQHLFVGASIGVAIGEEDGATPEELVRSADLALYRAKDEGGNTTCRYESRLHVAAEERRCTELALRRALDCGELSLVYQPVVDARRGTVTGCEALLRWTSPERGAVAPADFVPLAEETGLIRPIGEWVLRTACREAAAWPQAVSVAVNVSPLQLGDPGFVTMLVSALEESGLAAGRLELEITESVFLRLTPGVQAALSAVKALGVRLAIDDFGTGYSSLGYLRESRFDALKIDRSFVAAVRAGEPKGAAIVRAIVDLARSVGMTTVAEGVETGEQFAMLRTLGCHRIQGFAVARPVPAGEVVALLARSAACAAA